MLDAHHQQQQPGQTMQLHVRRDAYGQRRRQLFQIAHPGRDPEHVGALQQGEVLSGTTG